MNQNNIDESGTLLDEDLDLLINDIANDTSAMHQRDGNNEQALLDIDILNTQENNDFEEQGSEYTRCVKLFLGGTALKQGFYSG